MELRGAGLWGGHGARRTGPGEDQADDSASPRLRGRHGAAVFILRVPTNPGSSCAIRLDVRALRSRRSDLVPPSHIRGGRNTVHGWSESPARHARCARLRGAIFLQLAICRAVPGGGGGRLAAPRTPQNARVPGGAPVRKVSRSSWVVLQMEDPRAPVPHDSPASGDEAPRCGRARVDPIALPVQPTRRPGRRAVGAGLLVFLHHACHQQPLSGRPLLLRGALLVSQHRHRGSPLRRHARPLIFLRLDIRDQAVRSFLPLDPNLVLRFARSLHASRALVVHV
mmetsp:Transcript_10333/g.30521  ORF Transcript_10333/g.30521 Transcript_10333/m.30521 type:complete len:282 (+) Transcript_10333:462-1307(+)